MKARRTTRWLLCCVVVASLLVGFMVHRRNQSPALPALVRSERLPPLFDQAVRDAYEQIRGQPGDPDLVRKLARLYHANRFFAEARTCYAVVAAKSPGLSAHDRYYLADIAQNEGDPVRALVELRAVIALEPSYLPARVAAADILFKTGREEAAATEYAAVEAMTPNHPQAALALARLALQRGDDAGAISRLEKLLAVHPDATPAASLLSQILQRRGETDRAEALAQWSRQKHEPVPSDPWKESLLADCYDRQQLALKFEEYFFSGQIDVAAPFLARVEALDPKSWMPPLLLGFSHARAQRDEQALQAYRVALDRGGDLEKILPLMVTSLLQLGRAADAANLAGEYAAKKPDSLPILMAQADALTRGGDDAKTRPVLMKLLEKEPYLYLPNMSLAKILWAAGERDEAVKCLRRVAQTFPNDVASRGLLAQYHLEKSEPSAAILPLEQALEQTTAGSPARDRLTAMLTTAYFQVANAKADGTHFAEAIAYYDKVMRLAPAELAPYLGKANALVQLKQFPHAAETLEKMATLQPENPTIFLSLGDVLYQSGDEPKARRRWAQALQLTAAGDLELRKALTHRLHDPLSAEDFR